jgi:two-component system, NarL family, response regulator DevR
VSGDTVGEGTVGRDDLRRHARDVVTVVVVDDHTVVREGLRRLIELEPAMRVVGEASAPAEALAVVARERPSVVLLDLSLSPSSEAEGLHLCRALTSDGSGVRVIVLTMFLDDRYVAEAVDAGAHGYLGKDIDPAELAGEIQRVAAGRCGVGPRAAAALARTHARRGVGPGALSARELGVLRLLARGMSNRGIGRELHISEFTVSFHVQNVIRKLEVATRTEAVYQASRASLI